MINKTLLSENIKTAMVNSGHDPKTLAKATGLSTSCINTMLSGDFNAQLDTLDAVSDIVNVPIIELMRGVQFRDTILYKIAELQAFEDKYGVSIDFGGREKFLENIKKQHIARGISDSQISILNGKHSILPSMILAQEKFKAKKALQLKAAEAKL